MSDNQQLDDFLKNIDKSGFDINPYVRQTKKPWGWELHWVPDGLSYMGKFLHVDEGKRVSLQVHDDKTEAWILIEGNLIGYFENSDGELVEVDMKQNVGYRSHVGQRHRFKGGKGGGTVVEVSSPESGTTYRLEDDYDRPHETEELRQYRNEHLEDAR